MNKYDLRVKNISDDVHAFFRKTFANLHVEGPPIDRETLRSHPLVVASTHRSQADYFILGQVLYDMGIKNLRFAAGENLTSLPIIGPRFRALGAFSVKRKGALGPAYIINLCKSVAQMLSEGATIIVFPEGGRSYEGNMIEVKSGIIGAAVLAQARDPSRPVYYLPVSISYERLPELLYFDVLHKGRMMRKPGNSLLKRLRGNMLYFGADIVAFTRFLFAHRFGSKYGDVYVDYTAPIAVRDIVELKGDAEVGSRDEFSAHRIAMQTVGLKLYDVFMALYRILPVHVLAGALRERTESHMSEAASLCRTIVDELFKRGRNMATVGSMTGEEIVTQGIRQLNYMRAISVVKERIMVRNSWVVRYYAATIE